MTSDGRGEASGDDADSFLRAVAASPDIGPSETPSRIAQFRILGLLGRGGMGIVYKAYDEVLRREVALKLLGDAKNDAERRQRFLREARAAAGISHPNVASVYQVGEFEGDVYIAMELVDGVTLRRKLDEDTVDATSAKDIGLQIARGLAAAHERGVVHRDLKPENVVITPAGVVKLLDFGLAKHDRSGDSDLAAGTTHSLVTAESGRVMGTPAYMSPEQAMGQSVDVRSDVFTFGIVLYEMLSGARPFSGKTTGAVLVAIARDPPAPLRERTPSVDRRLEAMVMRCLAKAPAERFPNAAAIVASLEEMSSPTLARRRRTTVVAACGALVLTAAAIVVVARSSSSSTSAPSAAARTIDRSPAEPSAASGPPPPPTDSAAAITSATHSASAAAAPPPIASSKPSSADLPRPHQRPSSSASSSASASPHGDPFEGQY